VKEGAILFQSLSLILSLRILVGEWGGDGKTGNGGNRHGRGKYFWSNGDTYEGEWFLAKRKGFGLMRYASGAIYSGEWYADEHHGQGILYASNGTYSGGWCHGARHGHGHFKSVDGAMYEGVWDEDRPPRVMEVEGTAGTGGTMFKPRIAFTSKFFDSKISIPEKKSEYRSAVMGEAIIGRHVEPHS